MSFPDRWSVLLLAPLVAGATGCTHNQLRRSAVGQVGTVADIYQQQVLNNLARFAHDPNALPDFGVPTSGLATVADNATLGHTYGWTNTMLQSVGLTLGGGRNITQNWSLEPVRDPRKLELMRCAYRRAVGYGGCSDCCLDCEKRFAKFYTGDHCGQVSAPCQGCPDPKQCEWLAGADKTECEAELAKSKAKVDSGIVTSECLGSCWFHVGCSDCIDQIKKENPCCLIGEHCGTVVWVCPGRGTDELSKLTIAILDYATNDPKEAAKKPERTKEVIGYFKANGDPVDERSQAAYRVKVTLPADDTGEFDPEETTKSLQKALLGGPITAADIRPKAEPVQEGQPQRVLEEALPTRSDQQLQLRALDPLLNDPTR